MLKRIIALGLCLLMIVVLVGCGSKKQTIIEITLSTEDSEAILAAAGITLPDVTEVSAAGTTVKWFAWYDEFHNYSADEIVNTGFFTFKEKYGCEIEWIETTWAKRFDDLANLVLGGTSPDFYPGDNDTFPYYAIKGVFQPVDEYLDYSDPLWAGTKDFADSYFSLGGKHYMIITDVMFSNVVAYNRRVIDEWGFDDPAELYYNDEWTYEKFYEMCLDFSDVDEDRYALDGWFYDLAIMESSGTTIVTYDTEQQKFVSNMDDPRLERAANLLYDLSKNQCIFPLWNRGWQNRGGAEIQGVGIKEGLCLFFIVPTWGFTDTVESVGQVWGDMTQGEIMFCPLPRDDAGDGNYKISISTNGYCIVNGASNPEGAALLASCDRFKILDPTVVSIDRRQLEETYLWTDEMLEMFDNCKELARSNNTVLEYGDGLGVTFYNNFVHDVKRSARSQNAQSWAQVKEGYSESIEYYAEELNFNVAEYIAGLEQ